MQPTRLFKRLIQTIAIVGSLVTVITYANFEPNDTQAQSKLLTQGAHHIVGTGDDWFRVDVNPGPLNVSLTPDSGEDANMILHNSALQVIAADFQGGSSTERVSVSASTSESYYIKIFPTWASAVGYTLTLDYPVDTWSKTLACGPVRDVSVTLYDITGDGEDEIFVGTSKGLDASLNEVAPACLVALRADGSILWEQRFPAIAGTDPQTGRLYSTTSVSTPPTFADLDGDGQVEILVGVGADAMGEAGPNVVGQPGDLGGVYALDANGGILWFHESLDTIGGTSGIGDGRPDGVYGAPVVYDMTGDGLPDVIVNSWDQSTWILNGSDGSTIRSIHLADTIWATPTIADLDNDRVPEILVSADITANTDAHTQTGGIFHVISADGGQRTSGFDQPIGNPAYAMLRGKYEEQALWSSPRVADLDGDGQLEIIYGTGNFFHDTRGSYIRVWNHDGTQRFKLDTQGRTFATPLVADLDGDGTLEIVAATLDGEVQAWNHLGQTRFVAQPRHFFDTSGGPIFSAPVAADLTGDGDLEILFSKGAQLVILGADGVQLSDSTAYENIFTFDKGSPAVKDIDGDGLIDIVSGGNTADVTHGVVFRWRNPLAGGKTEASGRYQANQSLYDLRVDVAGTGQGQVVGPRSDIDCDTTCVARIDSAATVLLEARPFSGSVFKEWRGDCRGTDPHCQIALNGAASVQAIFVADALDFVYARASMRWQIAEIYLATMGYAPDVEGLDYWVNNIEAHTEWTPTTVAQSFFDQPLVQLQYPDGDPAPLIQTLYLNLFGRQSDEEGFAYWYDRLLSGIIQRNQMIIALVNGGWANPLAEADMRRFGNRVRVALAFADAQRSQGILYGQLDADARQRLRNAGRDVLQGVTGDETTVAAALVRIPELLVGI